MARQLAASAPHLQIPGSPSPKSNTPEPDWEVLADVPPPPAADADEGFVYTSHREAAYEVLVGGGEAPFLKNKPPAARSAVESAVIAAGQEGEGDECAVCKDGIAAGQRVKKMFATVFHDTDH